MCFENYGNSIRIILGKLEDRNFVNSIYNSFLYTLCTVTLQIILGYLTALLMFFIPKNRFSIFIWIIFFLPYAVPSTVAVISWSMSLREEGFISYVLKYFFNIDNYSWFKEYLLLSTIIVSVWQFYPFVYIGLLTSLRKIPHNLLRSSEIDGARFYQKIKYIIFPQTKKTLISIIVLRILLMFTKFDTPYLMGINNKSNELTLLPTYIYSLINISGINTISASAAMYFPLILVMLFTSIFILLRIKKLVNN